MGEAGNHQIAHVVGQQIRPTFGERPSPRGAVEADCPPWAHAHAKLGCGASPLDDAHEVVHDGRVCLDLFHPLLQLKHLRRRKHRPQSIHRGLEPLRLREYPALGRLAGVSDGDAHQEAVELAFGKRVGTVVLEWVLRRHHEKRAWKLERLVVDGDAAFLHGFEQPALRTGRGAIDLVSQDDVGEDRARTGFELPALRAEDGDAEHVGGQEVGRELDAAEVESQGSCQRVSQRGLAHTGNVFEQDVSPGEQRR